MSARKRVQENMIICRVRILALTLACAFAAGGVHADDSSKWFSVRGFGTLGVTHSNTSQGDYVANVRQPAGAGFSHDWAIGVDSKLGVQFDAKLTEQLTGVVQ